jgi:hypothetical protein
MTGTSYTGNQVGAMGPGATANNVTMIQFGTQIDQKRLADELKILRVALKAEASTSDHDEAIGAIASAEKATEKGDGAGASAQLKAAGKWALEVAEKIGVGVAVAALKTALGL